MQARLAKLRSTAGKVRWRRVELRILQILDCARRFNGPSMGYRYNRRVVTDCICQELFWVLIGPASTCALSSADVSASLSMQLLMTTRIQGFWKPCKSG